MYYIVILVYLWVYFTLAYYFFNQRGRYSDREVMAGQKARHLTLLVEPNIKELPENGGLLSNTKRYNSVGRVPTYFLNYEHLLETKTKYKNEKTRYYF